MSGKYGSAMLVSPLMKFALSFVVLFPFIMILTMLSILDTLLNGRPTNEELITVVTFVFTLLSSILVGVLNTGSSLFYLNIACGRRYSISDVFFGFRWQFKKSLALSAVTILWANLCMLPYQFFNYLYTYDPHVKWLMGMVLSYGIGVIVQLPVSLMLSQSFYLLLDFPKYSTKELLKLSIRVMKGHKGRLFFLQLSFIPLALLCILSFGIGYLWLYPYMNMTLALFFLDVMNPQKVSAP